MSLSSSIAPLFLLGSSFLIKTAYAHEHDESAIPAGEHVSAEPLDGILWFHILIQILAWGIIFPTGMVLGIVRSRWHVPLQILGTGIAVLGWFMGHAHKGRQFAHNIHASFAPSLMSMLFLQIGLGIYLRLHIEKGFQGRIRWLPVLLHGIVGKLMMVVTWVQFLFGGITALGFCHDDHLGQCLAHFIMGSAFIAYGILLTLMLLVGQAWLKRTGRSQEFFDSAIITAWGIVNTFTEHRWGSNWSHGDFQHTSMGIIWWCAGLVGLWLSRSRSGRPRRNLVPALVLILTGYAMSGHAQSLMLSTMVHQVFGYTLMGAGLTRLIEISFILRDRNYLSFDGSAASTFQYLPPFLLYASGFIFMGATEEQLLLIYGAGIDHVSYVLVLYSVSFLMFLFVNVLIGLYVSSAVDDTRSRRNMGNGIKLPDEEEAIKSELRKKDQLKEARRVKDAEEFELEGLISDDGEAGASGSGSEGVTRKTGEAFVD
jgi:hypothetical protein